MGSSISGAVPLLQNRDSSAFTFRLYTPGLAETGEKKEAVEAGHREVGCGLRPLGGTVQLHSRGEAANYWSQPVSSASQSQQRHHSQRSGGWFQLNMLHSQDKRQKFRWRSVTCSVGTENPTLRRMKNHSVTSPDQEGAAEHKQIPAVT